MLNYVIVFKMRDFDFRPNPNIVVSYEPIRQATFTGLLNGVANHEAKLAVAAIMASQPGEWFTAQDLHHEVRNRQGDYPGWIPDHKVPMSYCANSIAPMGLLVRGTVPRERGEVTAYRTTSQIAREAIAFSGALLDWSLKFPDISMQKLLGATISSGKHRAPEVRYRILRTFVEKPLAQLSCADICHAVVDYSTDTNDVLSHIRELAKLGLFETKLLDVRTDTKARIVDPTFSNLTLEFGDLSPELQATYRAMAELWESGTTDITFDQLVEVARTIDPSIDSTKLRRIWSGATSAKANNMPGLVRIERAIDDPAKRTTVGFNPKYSYAIVELLRRFDQLQTSALSIDYYTDVAHEILNDPVAMSRIFGKAKKFSSAVAGKNEGKPIEASLVEIISQLGKLSTGQLQAELARRGRQLTTSSVGRYLGRLAEAGELRVQPVQEDPTKRRVIKYYDLPQASTQLEAV